MEFILKEIEKELSFTFPAEITVFTKGENGIRIHYDGAALQVEYTNTRDLFRAALLCKTHGFAQPFDCTEKSTMEDITYMADCSRGAVYRVDVVKKLLRNLAACGYTGLHLYIEEVYEIPEQPVFGYLRGRYTQAELREMDEYACAIGMELIPCMQTLGHLERLTKYPAFSKLFDNANILMVGEQSTYDFIEQMFASLRSCFTTKKIHVGMDEAGGLGLGRYLKKHGLRDRFDILTEHLERVCELAKKYDFEPNMWSDMFFFLSQAEAKQTLEGALYSPDAKIPDRVLAALPENIVLTYWEYGDTNPAAYEGSIDVHLKMNRPIWFAGCSWKWGGMLPANYFSFETMRASLTACKNKGITHIMNTAWGDDGAEAALFSLLPSIAFFPLYANGYTDEEFFAQFYALCGYTVEDFYKLEYPNTYGELCLKSCHTTKVFLYQDPMLGYFDADLNPEKYRESFAKNAALLRDVPRGQYDYLFDFAAALSEAVYAKYDLGLRARTAYQAGDRDALAALPAALRTACEKVRVLREAFIAQWDSEAKAQGFEIHDIRLGGLMARLEHAARRIEEYLCGKRERLEELEEGILPEALTQKQTGDTYFCPRWAKYISANGIA